MKRSMKKVVSMLLIIAMVISATGCSSKSDASTKGDSVNTAKTGKNTEDITEITFWYSWTDAIEANNLALTEEFNNTVGKDKGIHVTAQFQGTYDDLHQKLQAAYVAGTTPEVTVMEIASVKTFAENGVLEPLNTYIERDNIEMDDFQSGLMMNSYVNDNCYALPYLRSTPIMYLNTTILKEAGLDPKGPTTWDELAEYAKTVKEKTGKYGVSMYSYIWIMEAFMMEYGTSMLNADETATNINGTQAKEIISFFNELDDAGYAHLIASAESDKLSVDVMNQNSAIWFSSTGDLTYTLSVAADNGFEVATAFLPKKEQYGVPTGGCNLIITSNITDEEKEAAWQFVKWLTQKEQTIKASQNTGYLPSRISAKDSKEMNQLYEKTPQFKVALDQLSYSTGRPMNPGYAESQVAIVEALDAIWINNQDIDTTLKATEKEVNQLLNE